MSIATTGKITATFGLMGTLFERTTTNPVTSPLPVPELFLFQRLTLVILKLMVKQWSELLVCSLLN